MQQAPRSAGQIPFPFPCKCRLLATALAQPGLGSDATVAPAAAH